MANNTRDANDLLNGLRPDQQDKALRDDIVKAKKVRETFLSYRKQLATSLKILDKHSDLNDQKAKEMADEVQALLVTLDKLEKRKKVGSDSLLDFITQMRGVGSKLSATANDKENKSALAEELRRQRQETLDDDKKQDSRFAKLADSIGQPLDKFIKTNASAIGTGGGSALKVAMAAWLGPAAPLVKLVDDLIDIDSKVAKAYTTTVETGKKMLKATLSAPSKLIKSGGDWAKSTLDYFKNRARDEDANNNRRDKRENSLLREQINNLKDMKKKLGRLGGGLGSTLATIVASLGGLLSKAIHGLGGILARSMAGLLATPAGKAIAGAFDKLKQGAKRVFSRGGQGPARAGANAGSFASKAMNFGKGALKVGGKALGAAGGAYGMVDGYSTIRDNKDKGFFEGGMNSRAGGYGSSIMGGAAVGATIGSIIPVVGTAVGGAVGAAVGGLSALIADNQDAIVGALTKGWDKAKDFGSKMIDGAKDAVVKYGPMLAAGPFGFALGAVKNALGVNADSMKKWTDSVGGWLSDTASTVSKAVSSGIDKMGDVVSGVMTKVSDTVSGAFSKLGDWLSGLGLGKAIDWAKEKADLVTGAVGGAYDSTKKAATDAVKSAWQTVGGWYDSAKESVTGAASTAGAAVSTAATAVGSAASGAYNGTKAAVLNTASSANNAIASATGVNPASYLPDATRAGLKQAKMDANYNTVKGDIQGAASQTGVNAGTLARFASIESGFNSGAKAKSSSAGGLYQFIDKTWAGMLKEHGAKYGLGANTSKYDPRANALMGAEYIKQNKASLSKSLGTDDINDTQLYMAHFLGAGGASQFFKAMQKNPDSPAAATMSAAAASNPSIFYEGGKGGRARSFREVYAVMANKVAKTDDIAAKANADAGTTGTAAMASTTATGTAQSGASEAAAPTATGVTQPTPTATSADTAATNDVHYIPKSTIPPTVDAGTPTQGGQASSGPSGTGGMKSSIAQVPFMPEDTNLLALNITGIIG